MTKLIFNNILKYKVVNILAGVMTILMAFYLVVALDAVFSISRSLKTATAENLTGDVIIASSEAKRLDVLTKDGEKKLLPLDRFQELYEYIKSDPLVAAASPRLRVWAQAWTEKSAMPLILTGVDPDAEPTLLPKRTLKWGRWLNTSNEVCLYYQHSDSLCVSTNDTIDFSLPLEDGSQNADHVQISGIFDYEDMEIYSSMAMYALVDLHYLNQLILNQGPDIATEVFVKMKDPSRLPELKRHIREKFGGIYRFIEPQDSANLIQGIYLLTFFVVFFIASVLVLMVYLCSSFLVSLNIESRRQEIGIYMAMGVRKGAIGLLFGGEFLITTLLAGAVGAVFGLYCMSGVSQQGIEASIIPLQLVFGRKVLYIQSDWRSLVSVALLLLATVGINTAGAIGKLNQVDPVEVMREL